MPARPRRPGLPRQRDAFLSQNVIDLFAGVGGLSLGAARAGFHMAAAVENDSRALATHKINFPATRHLAEDVSQLNGERLLELSGVLPNELGGLVGGPPCQGFSEMGLQANSDPRNDLFVQFFRLVAETRPAFYLAENVPGVLHARNAAVLNQAFSQLPSGYVQLPHLTVIASQHGAPTSRKRVFFIGYDPDRMKPLNQEHFAPRNVRDVRVAEAMEGLPRVYPQWQSEVQSWRSVSKLPDSPFAEKAMNCIPLGVGNAESLERFRKSGLVSGFLGTQHGPETTRRFRLLAPGEVDKVSKSRRLDRAGYCPTLRAGTGPERGSFQAVRPIHPTSPRVITPREAARLQGFPDWFQFHPTKWHSFRQIGNSVSPIVAESILSAIANCCEN